ncbi:ATP-binding cassette domain-containing protein [Streptomyces tateyamensis]|nr:ATP-binding cassette domain-containing protein [Streptomyces tateyamensis]
MIQASGLTKVYRRGRPALLDLGFVVRPGTVTVLLGPEGAGKTTALRLMLELEQGSGVTLFDGSTYRKLRQPERQVGVVLPSAYRRAGSPGRTARSHLRMLAAAVGVPVRRAEELLEQTRLATVADHRLRSFSPGMTCRLELAAALLGDPGTLLLDAPTDGQSPRNVEWLHAFVRAFAAGGGSVLVTTRSPQEAAQLGDRVVTLDGGQLLADQSLAEFRRTRLHPEVAVRGPQMARLADLLMAQGATVRPDGGAGLAVSGLGRTEIGELAYRNGILLHELADRVVEQPAPRAPRPVVPPAPVAPTVQLRRVTRATVGEQGLTARQPEAAAAGGGGGTRSTRSTETAVRAAAVEQDAAAAGAGAGTAVVAAAVGEVHADPPAAVLEAITVPVTAGATVAVDGVYAAVVQQAEQDGPDGHAVGRPAGATALAGPARRPGQALPMTDGAVGGAQPADSAGAVPAAGEAGHEGLPGAGVTVPAPAEPLGDRAPVGAALISVLESGRTLAPARTSSFLAEPATDPATDPAADPRPAPAAAGAPGTTPVGLRPAEPALTGAAGAAPTGVAAPGPAVPPPAEERYQQAEQVQMPLAGPARDRLAAFLGVAALPDTAVPVPPALADAPVLTSFPADVPTLNSFPADSPQPLTGPDHWNG